MNPNELELTKARETGLLDNQNSSLLSRQWEVIAGGLFDGVGKAGNQTASDIGKGAEKLVSAPLSTTYQFVKDHWHEAAVGAAITFLNPTKLANAALLAYSMRGLGYATYDGIVEAADPKVDISSARARYANAIGHESSAFISTLPMALAGGVIGRGAANNVFGKDLGALDLVTGKVKISQVKDNLWAMKDALAPPPVKLVITDMDNTLAPFGHYFAQGVKKGISELSQKTNIPEQKLYESIGRQMEIHRSHDYPWSLEIALKDQLKVGKPDGMSVADFRSKIVEPFWSTIDKTLSERHSVFPTVNETLQVLKDRNIPVAVLSDAPAFVGLRRLTNLGLDKQHIERLYALNNWKIPEGLSAEMLAAGHERINGMLGISNGLKEIRLLPAAAEKPHVDGFNALLKEYKVRPSETLMIGDSRVKDVGVAYNAGSRAIWAEYGNNSAVDEAILARLRPLPENGGAPGAPVKKTYAPYLEAAKSYDSVLSHLNPKANYREIAAKSLSALKVAPELSVAVNSYGLTDKPLFQLR